MAAVNKSSSEKFGDYQCNNAMAISQVTASKTLNEISDIPSDKRWLNPDDLNSPAFYSRFQITFHCNIPNFVAKF